VAVLIITERIVATELFIICAINFKTIGEELSQQYFISVIIVTRVAALTFS
jgi:hypothetical protein